MHPESRPLAPRSRQANAPFGGYKQSGVGREMRKEGFEEYLETGTVAIGVSH